MDAAMAAFTARQAGHPSSALPRKYKKAAPAVTAVIIIFIKGDKTSLFRVEILFYEGLIYI